MLKVRTSAALEKFLSDDREKVVEVSEKIKGVSATQWIRGKNIVAEYYRGQGEKAFFLNGIAATDQPKNLAEARKRVSVKYKVGRLG
jgi:hypothetical protein